MAASAHRLDEYLQVTMIDLARDHIALHLHLRLVPGVEVAAGVIRQMDTNHDGVLSRAEQETYVYRVTQNLSLSLNGQPLVLTLSAATFSSLTAIREGTGVLDLEFTSSASLRNSSNHLAYSNRGTATAWLVNCLLPRDPSLRVVHQRRSRNQSDYQLDVMVTSS
ncbi:hypothetical protein JK202_07400 [Gluconobacter sp. Dm-62]|uniref:hypothetical protein n=1 Tax=Gluconobacter sp. Dm-62 TaxID=2799804 RepID=UPI001B8AAF11|nr:hypothetical protein [Gluconobacter sp. Dm-62]MBS1102845.1 hypothetical protein [Gluconobacter sp. Dm-62]